MRFISIIILSIFCSCNYPNKTTNTKEKLYKETINGIELRKDLDGTGNALFLSEFLSDDFVKLWNQAESVGPVKFKPDYFLNVELTDGSVRSFKASSKYIQEKEDWCFKISDTIFFDKIFTMKIK